MIAKERKQSLNVVVNIDDFGKYFEAKQLELLTTVNTYAR